MGATLSYWNKNTLEGSTSLNVTRIKDIELLRQNIELKILS